MPSVNDVFEFLDSMAPISTQMSFDNSGFLVGEREREISHVGVVLDITAEAVSFARQEGIELIVSHHPVIFKPLRSLRAGSPAYELAASDISALCFHTPLDAATGGVNDVLASRLELTRVEPLPSPESESAILRAGFLPEPMTASELASHVTSRLKSEPRFNDCGKMLETVAVCGGAGGSFLNTVIDAGIDAYVTGDFNHHDFINAAQSGLTVVAAGHFETENPVVFVLAELISTAFTELEVTVIPQTSPSVLLRRI